MDARVAPPEAPSPPPGGDRPDGRSPLGEAFTWVSRITAVGLAMGLPAVAGGWLDERLGTSVLGPAGLMAGLAVALVWIVRVSRATPSRRRGESPGRPPGNRGDRR